MTRNNKELWIYGKENFSRINFLYQAAVLMAGQNNILSSYYGQLARNIAKKTTIRMDLNIKRNLCKRCSLVLKPSINSQLKVSYESRKKKHVSNKDIGAKFQIICQLCDHRLEYVVNYKHNCWLENAKSVVEVCSL